MLNSLQMLHYFLAYIPYFKKKVSLLGHHDFCVSVYPLINFWMAEPNFIKFGMYIMAPETI
jgi:hypothetical protein